MKDQREYLEHILEYIEIIETYVARGREALDDIKTQDAVIRRLQILAESSLHLTSELQTQHPEVGWGRIRNFRNRLVHEYFEVDLDLVWFTVENSLPKPKIAVVDGLNAPGND